jgi:hypothetical protein
MMDKFVNPLKNGGIFEILNLKIDLCLWLSSDIRRNSNFGAEEKLLKP